MKRQTVIGITAAFLVAACSTPMTTREKGAVTGAAIGAGTGAIIGSATGHTAGGALIGGAVGAVSGAVIGDAIQSQEQKTAAPAPSPPPPPPPPAAGPPLRYEPAYGVYVVHDHPHIYFHESHYYYWDGQKWYVTVQWGGPWTVVRTVPVVLAKIPPGHLRPGPPPWAGPPWKKRGW